ncbi:hypothetical protein [Thermomonospora amylolytica]|uniref:hypothetical protein n=1 Tax=Thermomonospora amylolytica TaxID=1411117 RepID=UPI00130086CC|nr:hypothetical protein [Thermomonospora amylolytica]
MKPRLDGRGSLLSERAELAARRVIRLATLLMGVEPWPISGSLFPDRRIGFPGARAERR